MPKKNINLAYSFEDTMPKMGDGDEKMYPSFTVHSDEKIDFPHEGEMTIKFKKIGSEDRDGRYTCTIEVRKIVSMYGDKNDAPYKRDKSAEEALDELAAKKRRKEDEEDDEY